MRTRDGGYRWILDRARTVSRDEAGRPLRMSGTHEDITDRKHIQEVLEESHRRLMPVLNAMEATIYVADMDTHEILFLNQSARQSFGPVEGLLCNQVLQGLDAPCPFCTNEQLVNADGSPARRRLCLGISESAQSPLVRLARLRRTLDGRPAGAHGDRDRHHRAQAQ